MNFFQQQYGKAKTFVKKHTNGKKPGKLALWAVGAILGLMILSYLFIYLLAYFGAFGKIPSTTALKDIHQPLATEVYAEDGALLGKYYVQNRSEVAYEDISLSFIEALIATEDARFYEHSGVDRRSMARVIFKSVLMGDKSSGGGSTLSQQLAKNLFPRQRYWLLSTPVNKLRETIIARRLERLYDKEKILALYANTVPFGESAFGIGTASRRFFNREASELKIEEAATLVGMLKATSYYNPRLHPERALQRRNVVLNQMQIYGKLSQEIADSLSNLPLEIDYQRFTPNEGLAPYFRAQLLPELREILENINAPSGGSYNLYTDGLKVTTTINSKMQRYAEKAVKSHMATLQEQFYKHWKDKKPWGKDLSVIERATSRSDRYRSLKAQGIPQEEIVKVFSTPIKMKVFSWEGPKDTLMSPLDSIMYYQYFLNAGFLAMEPSSGDIKAWVGGIDHHFFKYDHVTSHRPVGSTFKPLVYTAALKAGRSPCEYILNELKTYEAYENWQPGNSDGEYGGYYSMKGGLMHSVNTTAVALMMETGVENVLTTAYKLGIEKDLPDKPAIALGAADLSLLELLPVYSVYANGGYRVRPRKILNIKDRQGRVLYESSKQISMEAVLDRSIQQMMVEMLKGVVDSGTARAIRYRYGIKGSWGGKTGTTQDQADGWFVGFNPSIVAAAWVGGEDPRIRFRSLSLGQGARTALPIWGTFMRDVQRDRVLRQEIEAEFPLVDPMVLDSIDCPNFLENLDDENDRDPVIIIDFDWFKRWQEKQKEKKKERQERRKKRRENRFRN